MATVYDIILNKRLALEVQKYPCLYKTLDKGNLDRKEAAWYAIVEALDDPDLTVEKCKKRWTNLRGHFQRTIKKTGDHYAFAEMGFILPYLKFNLRSAGHMLHGEGPFLNAGASGPVDGSQAFSNYEFLQGLGEELDFMNMGARRSTVNMINAIVRETQRLGQPPNVVPVETTSDEKM